MSTRTISNLLAPSLWVMSTAVAAANWYLQPERRMAWATAIFMLACVTVAFLLVLFGPSEGSSEDQATRQRFRDSLRSGIVFSGLIVLISLGWKLATALGASADPDLWRRATMVVIGGFLVSTGNSIPKKLAPLYSLPYDAGRFQAFMRFAGWTWVLTGLALALTWVALPVQLAESLTLLIIPGAMLVIGAQFVRLRRTRQGAA
ncbi:MAG TPA: hypothetical protein VL099_11680 [Candidatus Binatia bacterium]|nr:hypothetical protein [Candidatus Binatia bacterium]